MKQLVIIAHPCMAQSQINRRWKQELEKYPAAFTVHELYKAYPGWKIDVAREQQLVEQHTDIIFQFPFYWFSCPPLLRLWYDEVLARGWAYGSGGNRVAGKRLLLAVSTGITEADYRPAGKYLYTMEELLRPFELIARYTGMHFTAPFIAYGIGRRVTNEVLERSAEAYVQYLFSLRQAGCGCPVL